MTVSSLDLTVQFAQQDATTPARKLIETWVRQALAGCAGAIAVRVVDEVESAELNQRFGGKPGPTNVLAFPAGDVPVHDEMPPLGDVVVCGPIVAREAEEQGKTLQAHWAHIVIHGCLHLVGYDHVQRKDAEVMEAKERALLAELGIADPYSSDA